jgi:signal transduction histidine kinase
LTTFAESIARVLDARATELADRWRARASAATPRPSAALPLPTDVDRAVVPRALAGCLNTDARCQGEVMRLGWEGGAAAHAAGLAVHHVLKDADLLLAILLTAAEEATAGELADVPATPSEAFNVARRLQRAVGLYSQAAASSYLHALVTSLRARWRLLRHDLRNPLGTIQSALSLMEDETMPVEARSGPRVRAMMARNAVSLEDLIAARLDDRVAEAMLAVPQDVSLRDVAIAVRRSLREPARLAECEIIVEDSLPTASIDAAALELTLSTLLLAAVACAHAGDALRVQVHPLASADVVTIRVVHEPAFDSDAVSDIWDTKGLALASSLAEEYGGSITPAGSASVELSLPLIVEPQVAPKPAARRSQADPRAIVRHARDDVARAD